MPASAPSTRSNAEGDSTGRRDFIMDLNPLG